MNTNKPLITELLESNYSILAHFLDLLVGDNPSLIGNRAVELMKSKTSENTAKILSLID